MWDVMKFIGQILEGLLKITFKLHCPYFMKSENKGTDWIRIASWYHEWGTVKINVTKQKKSYVSCH